MEDWAAAILEPLDEGDGAGPDLSATAEFRKLDDQYRSANAAQGSGDKVGFENLRDATVTYLVEKSKDLRAGAFLVTCLLRTGGVQGLAQGFDALKAFVEAFWDHMHPDVPDRFYALEWISDELPYAVYLLPLTPRAHNYVHFRKWWEAGRKKGAASEVVDETTFHTALVSEAPGRHEELAEELEVCLESLGSFLETCDGLFKAADARSPTLHKLTEALENVQKAANVLHEFRVAPEKVGGGPGGGGGPGPGGGGTGPEPPPAPKEPWEMVAEAARQLRTPPSNPAPFLMVRGFRWGELLANEDLDPLLLEGPSDAVRKDLNELLHQERWGELLLKAEEVMVTPVGRAWLDLQRYAITASEKSGYAILSSLLRERLAAILESFPQLPFAQLKNDRAAASADTLSWLVREGFLDQETALAELGRRFGVPGLGSSPGGGGGLPSDSDE